ncbi:16445_t:CDS:2, partial [Gigaspora rosea]
IKRKFCANGTVIPVSRVDEATWKLGVELDSCLQNKADLCMYMSREILEGFFMDKLRRNIESNSTNIRFYINSLAKLNSSVGKVNCGIGWISFDSIEENRLDELSLNVDSWPSSLQLELIALWTVCLAVGCDAVVEVISENDAALTSLSKVGMDWTASALLKMNCPSAIASILDLVKAKNINLTLTKNEENIEESPMLEALHLAKSGMLQRLSLKAESVKSERLLFWSMREERRLEVPIKLILKKGQELRNKAAWWCSESIKKLEPEAKEKKFYWKAFWNFLKSLKGIWGDSLIKSERKSFLVKCISEKLPVLTVLSERKPELYTSEICVLCDAKEVETQDHLATCRAHGTNWEKVEDLALEEAWNILDNETSKDLDQSAIRQAFFGLHNSRRKDLRVAAIKYVVPIEVILDLQSMGIGHNMEKLLVDKFLFALWKGFFEIIWKERCKRFSKWEESQGITAEKKREKSASRPRGSRKKSRELDSNAEAGRAKKKEEVERMLE